MGRVLPENAAQESHSAYHPYAAPTGATRFRNEGRGCVVTTFDISGMGGGYEITCQLMLQQGLAYVKEHPDFDPRFMGFQGIYGILMDDNADAKALSTAITFGVDGCTGAQHQAVIGHLLHIKKVGWDQHLQDVGRERWIEIPFDSPEAMREWLSHPENCQYETAQHWPKASVPETHANPTEQNQGDRPSGGEL
jgi:hypothetical protein